MLLRGVIGRSGYHRPDGEQEACCPSHARYGRSVPRAAYGGSVPRARVRKEASSEPPTD